LRLNGRGCAGAGASGIAAIIYGWVEKSPRNKQVIAKVDNIHIKSAHKKRRFTARLAKHFVQNLRRYFFNERT
jgi:hypothetical protein